MILHLKKKNKISSIWLHSGNSKILSELKLSKDELKFINSKKKNLHCK